LCLLAVAIASAASAAGEEVDLKLPNGFKAHQLYRVPKKTQGSWVCIAFDARGRLIASRQNGGLYRLTLPPVDQDAPPKVERLNTRLGSAQGMLWAFDSLYVTVNGRAPGGQTSGLYRLRDTTGDDQLDKVEQLAQFDGRGEHGPHGLALTPDGKGLYVIAGNGTRIPKGLSHSRVPRVWAEDQLLPRQHYRGRTPAPGGWVCRTDPEGKTWELHCVGLRNPYDIAVDRRGGLFTFDSDNERDVGQPWYRPTRVCYLASGGDYGWRTGSGKWPKYYADSLPPAVEIGLGSPTGVAFGYGTRFPRPYRDALYILDWSFGRIYAVHLRPDGAGYRGTKKIFATGKPLPVTDIAVGPDGAMYFTTGGRGMQSNLYRIRYEGRSVDVSDSKSDVASLPIEQLHTPASIADNKNVIDHIFGSLASDDRFVRHAARVALEHRPVKSWRDRALAEANPTARINAVIALARTGETSDGPTILKSLGEIPWLKLDQQRQLELLRAYQLTFIRFGKPTGTAAKKVIERLDPLYPADGFNQNRELSQQLVYIESPTVAAKTLDLLTKGRDQQQQIHFALVLRLVEAGWTLEQRKTYFRWFNHAQTYKGGEGVINNPAKSNAIFRGILKRIRNDAIKTLSDKEKTALKEILDGADADFRPKTILPAGGGKVVEQWTVDKLLDELSNLKGRDFQRGRSMYTAASCAKCHRFAGEGEPIGPDLSSVVARFDNRALLESIIEPSKVVSDQYQQLVVTTKSGLRHTGFPLGQTASELVLRSDPSKPSTEIRIALEEIDARTGSKVSAMPLRLLDLLNRDEALDLLAYLMSRGNPQDPVFKK